MHRTSKLVAGVFVLVSVLALARKHIVSTAAVRAPTRQVAPTDSAPNTAASAASVDSGPTLRDARRGFQTTVTQRMTAPMPLPNPPSELFVRTDYASTDGLTLAAYITPDPRDGRRHPAIIWLTGGDSNSLDEFWTPRGDADDESASAYRNAGVVTMFPTLRGGNTNGGVKEYFLGEVDDVIAAAEFLARQSYVDPEQIYLGGHSTGGTLALLTAETSDRFKAVFAFGPVATVDRYPASLVPADLGAKGSVERRLRSPINWLHGISIPTYLIEGQSPPSNRLDVEQMCARTHNALVRCIIAAGSDHFSVLSRVSRVIAARLSVARDIPFTLRPDEFGPGAERD